MAARRAPTAARQLRRFFTTSPPPPTPPSSGGGGLLGGAAASTGVGVAAAVAAVAFLPQFSQTREGFVRGLAVEAHASDHVEFWLLQGVGGVLGGLGGYQISGALLSKLVSEGRTGGAWLRVPVCAAGGVMFAVLGKELAQPAATLGLKAGKAVAWGMDGLQADLVGRPEGHLPAWEVDAKWTDMIFGRPGAGGGRGEGVPAEVPPEPLAGTVERMRVIDEKRAAVKDMRESGTLSEEEALSQLKAHDDEEVSAAERDASLRDMGQNLCRLRSEKASLKKSLVLVRAESAAGAREYGRRIKQVNDAMKALKQRAQEEYGVSLGRVVKEEVKGRAQQLDFLRVEQLRIRGLLAERVGYQERRDLSKEFERLDRAKRQLKAYVASHYGEKLSRHATTVAKRP